MGLGKMSGPHLSAQSWGCFPVSDGPGGRIRLGWVGGGSFPLMSFLFVPLVSPHSGIWSNLYAANLQDSLYWASEPSQFWDRWAQDQANLGGCLGSL